MLIYLCRHGHRTPDGKEVPAPPTLNHQGHESVKRIAEWLAVAATKPLKAIYSSPKIRAIQSALPTANKLNLKVVAWPCLIEHNSYGPLDYSPHLISQYNAILDENMLLSGTPIREEKGFAYKRAEFTIATLRQRHQDDAVALFCHDCFNSIFIWAWLGLGCLAETDRYHQHEACVNILEDDNLPIIDKVI